MNRLVFGRILVFIAGACLASALAFADGYDTPSLANLKVGAAAVELRGDDAMPIAGGIGPGKATGQDGMLRAVATVVQGPPNGTRVAIVALDILMIRRDYLDAAAKEIEQRTGILKGPIDLSLCPLFVLLDFDNAGRSLPGRFSFADDEASIRPIREIFARTVTRIHGDEADEPGACGDRNIKSPRR